MKNLAEKMKNVSNTITNKDKLDTLFNALVFPLIEKTAEKKQTEVSFNSFGSGQSKEDKEVQKVFPKIRHLQDLIGGEMKPYLIKKGFKVITCSPAYYTYIRW